MHHLPHDRRAIIYLNALEEAQDSDKKDLINRDHVMDYFHEIEENEREPKTIDEQLAHLGMQLSHAIIEERNEDVERLETEYATLAENHPATAMLATIPEKVKFHSVPNYDYRNWKGTSKGLQYGVINGTIDDDAVIGIIGDWGTGDPDAQQLLQEMKDNHAPDLYIHLGDIYNSCRWHTDVLPKFIDIFDAVYPKDHAGNPTRPPILTIPGNHDYMSHGGYGFFKLIDNVNAHHPTFNQEASYFCLRTKSHNWQFLGADTGINDPSFHPRNEHPGLEPDEYTWHYDKMKHFANKGKGRTIFMTHHPLFSATHHLEGNSYVNPHLSKGFDGYLTGGSVQANEIKFWIWGHNHWFIPYTSGNTVGSATLDKGRLIGGSARHDPHSKFEIVSSASHVIQGKKNGVSGPLVPDSNNQLPNHTYAIMKLSAADIEVTHYQIPSWHKDDDSTATKSLPAGQHKVLLREWVLDTHTAQKYPSS